MTVEQEATGNEGAEGTAPPPPSQFSQDDVTRIAAREKDQGKRQGQREALESLGLGSIEEAQELKQALEAAQAAETSELTKAKTDAEKARTELKTERAAIAAEKFTVRVERELMKVGAPLDQVAKIARLVEADVDSEAEEITTAVADLKADMPQLFSSPGSEEGDETPPPGTPKPPGTDPGGQPKGKPAVDSKSAAKALLEKRHGAKLKSNS